MSPTSPYPSFRKMFPKMFPKMTCPGQTTIYSEIFSEIFPETFSEIHGSRRPPPEFGVISEIFSEISSECHLDSVSSAQPGPMGIIDFRRIFPKIFPKSCTPCMGQLQVRNIFGSIFRNILRKYFGSISCQIVLRYHIFRSMV